MGNAATQRSVEIQVRFFRAFKEAIRLGKIKSLRNFCLTHGLNRTKYSQLLNRSECAERETGTEYRLVDMAALAALCEDANVSARWLLLGIGHMFRARKGERAAQAQAQAQAQTQAQAQAQAQTPTDTQQTSQQRNDDNQSTLDYQIPAFQTEQGYRQGTSADADSHAEPTAR